MVTRMTETGMDDDPIPEADERNLRFLRRLVTVLTATMILGVLAIVILLVIRLQAPSGPYVPDAIELPAGATATAYTQGTGWIAIVTDSNEILIYDPYGHDLVQRIPIVVGK
jgi:hypothetical protein